MITDRTSTILHPPKDYHPQLRLLIILVQVGRHLFKINGVIQLYIPDLILLMVTELGNCFVLGASWSTAGDLSHCRTFSSSDMTPVLDRVC